MKFVFVFFAFLIPFLGFTQVGTIQGVVKNREGRLIEYATVGLEGTTFGGITFSDGSFELADIPYGKYVLKVQLIGFEIYVEHLVLNKESISILINNVKNFSYYNKKYNFDLVLTSNEFPIFEGIFNYCNIKSIKTLDFLHGGTVGFAFYQTILQEYFRDNSKLHFKFVYSERIKNFQMQKRNIFNINQQYIVTGSNKYSEIFNLNYKNKNYLNNNKINVCYVIGGINNNSIISKGIMNDIFHILTVFKLVKIFSIHKNINFYIKFGYDVEKKIQYFLSTFKHIKNIEFINSKQRLSNLINKMDLFILDTLGTPLFELAATKKPIIFYDNNILEFHSEQFINDLNNRVKVISNEASFLKFCKNLNQNPAQQIKSIISIFSSKNLFYNYCNQKKLDSSTEATKKILEIIK